MSKTTEAHTRPKLSALTVDHLRQRALRAKREDFLAFLAASPDVPPMPGDEKLQPA
jgi:hypothetical protein